jgi:2',3'-cyclic-nucleotide 2'-phosphodiesterase (5'-nucleotidase family)
VKQHLIRLKHLILILCLLLFFTGATGIGWAQDGPGSVTITIFHTSDEHGWLSPFTPSGYSETRGGVANMVSWWAEDGAVDPDTTLILSSGDNWTGQALSSLLQGEPVVDVFNFIGYDAAAIGNHEFDFGLEAMRQRFSEANFPYLSANIREAETGDLADFATPYVILDVSGVQVGVIGLTTTQTGSITNPNVTGQLEFTSYVSALDEFVPQMRDEGAEIVLLLAHVCPSDLVLLASQRPDLVDAMFAGHCHEFSSRERDGVPILSSGEHLTAYSRLDIVYNTVSSEIEAMDADTVVVSYDIADGNPVEPDEAVVELVAEWEAGISMQLTTEIGYTEHGMSQRSPVMGNWVTDAWLWAFPQADIALTNWGGLRQDLPAGVITLNDVINIMPFDNTIVEIEITAQQLAENLYCCGGAVGGMRYSWGADGVYMTLADGSDFDRDATYRVLINNYMYDGGSDYLFGQQDPNGVDTGIHWRQPVIDYMITLNTSSDDPLEGYLDEEPRSD